MRHLSIILAAGMLSLASAASFAQTYSPTKDNIQNRQEFARERFGIFLHWGIYASYAQGEWYLQTGKLNKDEYAKAAGGFYPAGYNAYEWVKAFKDAGAEYVTITSRHHDGFSMYDTKASDYNIVKKTPWGKDVLKDLADACHDQGMYLHYYYSLLDWMREDYPVGRTGHDTGRKGNMQDYDSYFNFMKQQVKELLTNYAPIRAVWFDGYWDHDSDKNPFDWRMPEFYEYIHSIQPDCLIGNNHHIATIEGEDFQMFEQDLPGQNTTGFAPNQVVSNIMPLEMCMTMNKSWGYSVKDQEYKSVNKIIQTLATAVSLNSNLLLNIGPRADGRIPEQALASLRGIGKWMKVNSKSIKGCGPGPIAKQDWGVSTAPEGNGKVFYLHIFEKPNGEFEIPVPKKAKIKSVMALEEDRALEFKKKGEVLTIALPEELPDSSSDLDPTGADYVVEVTLK